jgi:hypothetical protein
MLSRSPRAWPAVLTAFVVSLVPCAAEAHGAAGMGAVAASLLIGLPSGLTLIILAIVSAAIGRRPQTPSKARRVYGRIAAVVAIVLTVLDLLVVGIASYLDLGRGPETSDAVEGVGVFIVMFGGPMLLLGLATFLLSRRVTRNNALESP